MNRRIARKIVNSPWYFDVWVSPHGKHYVDIPHSAKHWYLWLKACDTIKAHNIKNHVIYNITKVVDEINDKMK